MSIAHEAIEYLMTYREKLRDPRWQKLRLEIMSRDGWRCQGVACATRQNPRVILVVHHKRYVSGRDPWDYSNQDFRIAVGVRWSISCRGSDPKPIGN